MIISAWVVTAYCIIFCVFWYIANYKAIRVISAVNFFENTNPDFPEIWPSLSVIIAACNEAETIKPAISTLLNQDYPNLEIIMVNDRSTDNTGQIIKDISKNDSRIKDIHIQYLPSGWLGKVNALDAGTKAARGEWLLYTDADVHFKQGILRKAIAFTNAEKCDHLALMPVPHSSSFLLEVITKTFGIMFLLMTESANAGNPGSKACVGIGAFNLVRRSSLEKTNGFSWLRMEVADDVGLGLMLKQSKAKSCFEIAREDLNLTWYSSISKMFTGLEKNLYGVLTGYSYINMAFYCIFAWAFI
ncbi:MAG: glycosyltransferase family 2 protein, partial [Candidatus Theseobacter exili]|nr:glycosyltransferase family 2 protein [Candidatus Theseobacter exili]